MKSAVIYGLFDPVTNYLRYVGKTVSMAKRMECHIYNAKKKGKKVYSRRWIASLLNKGLRPQMEILEEVGEDQANDAERFWIAAMRLAGCRLTNRTDGGDGQPKGYKWSDEARRKISLAGRGRKQSEETKAKLRAAFRTPDEVAKRRARTERLKKNPEWLAKVRLGFAGREHREESKKKIAASWTEERKKAHAIEKSSLPFDDRWKKQLGDALQKRWERDRGKPISQEHKEALARGRKARWDIWRAEGKPKIEKKPRSDARFIELNGEKLHLAEWSKRTGIKRETISVRISQLGWSIEKALTTPVKRRA